MNKEIELKPCREAVSVEKIEAIIEDKLWYYSTDMDDPYDNPSGIRGIDDAAQAIHILINSNTRPIEDQLQAENERLQELIGIATEHLARIHLRSSEQGVKDIADNALEQLMPDEEAALQHNEEL